MQAVDIGLSLLAIKRLCERTDFCVNCPLLNFCCNDTFMVDPCYWNEESLPKVGDIVALTNVTNDGTIKVSSPV